MDNTDKRSSSVNESKEEAEVTSRKATKNSDRLVDESEKQKTEVPSKKDADDDSKENKESENLKKELSSEEDTEDIKYNRMEMLGESESEDETDELKGKDENLKDTNDDLIEDSDDENPTESEVQLFLKEGIKKEEDSNRNKPSTSQGSQLSPIATTIHHANKKQAATTPLKPCDSCELLDPFEIPDNANCFAFLRKPKDLKITDCWLISVPKEETSLEILNKKTYDKSRNYKFHIPVLKVGTLNTLVSLTEQLKSLEKFVREVTQKLCEYVKEELEDKPDAVKENLKVQSLHPVTYLTRFTWNKTKYATWLSIPKIADLVFARVDRISQKMHAKLTTFEKIKMKLRKYEHKESDNLKNRYLGDIVKKEHFVYTTYLTTLLVVVPNNKVKQWLDSYENLCELVVPQSSIKLFKDATHSLFTVIVGRKKEEDFKANARQHNFLVREYEYSEKAVTSEKAYYESLVAVKARELAMIFRWTRVHFGECFEAWIHVLALRIFVESVLRFGLPVNYDAMLLLPFGSKFKLKKTLGKLYKHVDTSLSRGYIEEVPGTLTTFDVQDFTPYVFFDLDLEFVYM